MTEGMAEHEGDRERHGDRPQRPAVRVEEDARGGSDRAEDRYVEEP
jgi:hypothetical protein